MDRTTAPLPRFRNHRLFRPGAGCLLACLWLFGFSSPAAPPVAPPAPLVLPAPKAAPPPTIDGVMTPGEWDNAVSWPLGGWHFVDVRTVQFFLHWDADNVYVAARTTFLPNEPIVRIGREPKPDIATAWETAIEIFLDAATAGSNKMPCRYHVIANACGNLWDVEEQYTIGITRQDWNGKWQYAQQITPNRKCWVAEFAIPRQTIYQQTPLRDGLTWLMGFAREGAGRPNGNYGYGVPVTFRDAAPVFQLSGVEASADNKLAFALRIANPTTEPFSGRLTARLAGGTNPSEERDISLPPGQETMVTVDKPAGLKQGQKGDLSIEVRSGDALLFRWAKPVLFDDLETRTKYLEFPPPKAFDASVRFNPVRNFLRLKVDRYEHPTKTQVAACRFEVQGKGKEPVLATGTADRFSFDVAESVLPLPADLPAGEYTVRATLVDRDGQALGKLDTGFTKKDPKAEFPWWENKIGISDRVLWPFQPMTTAGTTMRPWNREMAVNGLALPATAVADGRSLLAGPLRLHGQAGGQPFTVEPAASAKAGKNSPTMAEFTGTGQGGPVKAGTFLHMDYDGCARVELTLEPTVAAGTEIEKLMLDIPFRADQATLMHTFRMDMRQSCYAGAIPAGNGRVWDSTKVPVNQMTVGSLVPLVFIGNPACGLTWFADSDKGWWPTDSAPGLEILRQGGEVVLRLNLAAEKATLAGRRTIVFGLHLSPVRPLDVDTWTPGSGICGLAEYDGRFDRKTQKRGFYMYPAHPQQFNDYYTRRFNGRPMGIYTENGSTDVSFEEEEYFADEWVGPGGQANVRTRSLTDCSLYYAQKILQECPIIHGFYIDNIYIRDSLDPETSHAYVLPDGRIQPGFDVWELRDYVRRLRTLLQDMRRNPHGIEVHMTCTMAIPIYGWADCMREGENPVEADNGRKDFADLYPPEFSAIMNNPHPWGVRSVHHWMFYTRFDLFKAIGPDALWKAERTGIGHLALHDNLFPRPEGEPYMRLIKAYDAAFRGAPGPERIVPYWNPQGLVSTKTVFGDCSKDIKVTVYRRAGRIAVWIMNYAREERDAWVWLDLPRLLGDSAYSRDPAVWPYPAYALDLESGEPVKLTEPYAGTEGAGAAYADRRNIVQVKVPARDFRIVLVK